MDEVGHWLATEAGLAAFVEPFARARVNGAALLRLAGKEEPRLAGILGSVHPLNKRKLLLAVSRLREREFCETAISIDMLDEYIAQLDATRMAFVARLKVMSSVRAHIYYLHRMYMFGRPIYQI